MKDPESQKGDKAVVKTVVLGDTCPTKPGKPLTVMAKHHVRPDKLHVFADWCREMQQRSRTFAGYIDTELIRPTCIESDEYVAIFRYDNYEHLKTWMESKERKEMIERVPEFSSTNSVVYAYHSLEHWFSSSGDEEGSHNTGLNATKPAAGPPPKYKMVVVTTAIIYTQTLWVPKVLNRILGDANLHPDVMGLLTVMCIVCLATYVLFPIVTRLLAFWLFPTANYRDKLRELVPLFFTKHGRSSINGTRDSTGKGTNIRSSRQTQHQDSSDTTPVADSV